MPKEVIIKASEKKCQKEGCKNKGYRWICADPDIQPVCYCKKHIREFEEKVFKILNERKNQSKD